MKSINLYFTICLLVISASLSAQVVTGWEAFQNVSRFNDWQKVDNTIYVATDAGIFLLDAVTHQVTDHWTRSSVGLPSNRVEAIAIDPITQTKYIGTYDIGIGFQAADGTWELMPYPEELAKIPNLLTYCINFDKQDRMLVGTNRGLLRWEGDDWSIINVSTEGFPFLQSVWEMKKMASGEVLLGGHVLAETAGDDVLISVPVDSFGNPALFSYSDTHTHIAADGTVFVITDIGEMGMRNETGDWEIWSTLNGNSDFSFHGSEYFFEEESGVIWVDLGWQGFARLTNGEWELLAEGPYHEYNFDNLWQLQDAMFGMSSATLSILVDEELELTQELGNMPWEEGLFRLRKDQDGTLWTVAGGFSNSYILSLSTGEQMELNAAGEDLYPYDFVFDRNNDFWFISGSGVHHLSDGELIATYDYSNSILPEASLRSIVCDGNNNIWVGTYEDGMYVKTANGWVEAIFPAYTNILNMVGKSIGEGLVLYTYSSLNGVRLIDQTISAHTTISLPTEWSDVGFSSFTLDGSTGEIWAASSGDELAVLRDANTWEIIPLPEEWNEADLVRKMGIHESGLWLMGQLQIAFMTNGEWEVYNSSNSPLDTERLYDAELDMFGDFWMFHNQVQIVEVAHTALSLSTDIPEITAAIPGQVYPNPSTEIIYLDWEDQGTAYILDVNGRLVLQQHMSSTRATGIQVASLAPGSYWLLWHGDKGQRLAPFIKQQ